MKNNQSEQFERGRFSGGILSPAPIMGMVTVANASAADAAHLSQALTDYVAGIPGDDLETRLEEAFPAVPVSRRFEFQSYANEAFLAEVDDSDIRGVGAPFKRVEYSGSRTDSSTHNKGLTLRIDKDQIGGGGMPEAQRRATENLRKRLLRADYYRGIAALDSVDSTQADVYSASTNPDGLLRAAVTATKTAVGIQGNVMLIGDVAWQLRQDAYEAASRANHAMANRATMSEEQVAAYLGLEKVLREKSLYQSKKGGTKTDFLAGVLYIYNAESGLMKDDPSNIKRFVSDTDGGGRFGVYVEEKAKFVDVTVEHYSRLVVTLSTGVVKRTVTAS